MNLTSIEWTTFSANPLKYRDASGKKVWGCVHHSPGCVNCYAESLAKRYGNGGPFNAQTMRGLTPFLDDDELHKMLTAKEIKNTPVSGSKCFVGDMTDIFGEWVPDALLDRLFAAFALRSDVTWQVLTKRADRMFRYFTTRGVNDRVGDELARLYDAHGGEFPGWLSGPDVPWEPLSNVWLGVSCEDQKRTDERLPHLLQTPAAVRFISAEPLLEGLDIAKHRPGALGLHLVIIGAESGQRARPCEVWWIENLMGQCRYAGIAPFVKQLGAVPLVKAGRIQHWEWRGIKRDEDKRFSEHRDGVWRVHLRDNKGGDMREWPESLRVREFPVTQREAVTS
jgi:protein gp37